MANLHEPLFALPCFALTWSDDLGFVAFMQMYVWGLCQTHFHGLDGYLDDCLDAAAIMIVDGASVSPPAIARKAMDSCLCDAMCAED